MVSIPQTPGLIADLVDEVVVRNQVGDRSGFLVEAAASDEEANDSLAAARVHLDH